MPAGLRRAYTREREVLQGRREAPKAVGCCPPPLYRPPGGAPALEMGSQGGRWPKGGRGCLAPQGKWEAPHPRVPNPRRMGGGPWGAPSPLGAGSLPLSAHGALRDRWPHPVDPRDPSGGPGTIPVTPETFPVAKTGLPIYNSSPPDHSGTSRDVRDLIRDSEQLSGFRIHISL